MKKLLFCLAICMGMLGYTGMPVQAQTDAEQDSLQSLLPFAKESQRVDILNALAMTLRSSDTLKAKEYARQAMSISNKLSYTKGLAGAHIVYGIIEKNRSRYDFAKSEFAQGLALALKSGDPTTIGLAYHNLGNLYYIQSDYPKALRFYIGALRIGEQQRDYKRIARTTNNIGSLYMELGDLAKAEQFYLWSYELHKDLNDIQTSAQVANNLGNIYHEQGYDLKALYHYTQCLEVFRKLESGRDISSVLNNIGSIYLKRKQPKKAQRFLRESYGMDEQGKDIKSMSISANNLAETFYQMNRFDSALYYASLSYRITGMNKLMYEKAEAARMLSLIYNEKGDKEKALQYQQEKEKITQEILSTRKAMEVATIQSGYEGEHKDRQIKTLNTQSKKQEETIITQKTSIERKNVILFGLIVVIFFLGVIAALLIYSFNINRKRKDVELSAAKQSNVLQRLNHELRTPLTSMIGLSNLAAESRNINELREYLAGIRYSGDELLFLLNNLICYLEIDSKADRIYPVRFGFIEALYSHFKSFEMQCKQKGILFSQLISPDVPSVLNADKLKIMTIIQNLLNNALKFSDSGVIKIEIRNLGQHGKVAKHSTTLQVVVSDEGTGMTDKELKNAFRGITGRNRSEQSKNYGGFGVGLFVTKHFAERMHGKASLKKNKERGTVASVSFDVEVLNEGIELKPNAKQSNGTTGKDNYDILLVEDNVLNQKTIQHILVKSGHQVEVASNGLEALNRLKGHSYDLILMDIQMPEMDGIEATNHIRNDAEFSVDANIPIIAISANADPQEIQKCLETGFNEYFVKPVNKELLLHKIEELCSHRNLTEA